MYKNQMIKVSRNLITALFVTVMAQTQVLAVEKVAEKSPWKRSAELGFVQTTGNTETQSTSAKADVSYEAGSWKHTGHGEAFSAQNEDKTTGKTIRSAERYLLSGKSDYKFNDYDYMFGLIELKKDNFSGFEYERIVSIGYGRKVIKQTDMELTLEIGPGVRFFKVEGGEADNEALLRLAANYWWQVSKNAKFTQDLIVEIGEEITSTKSVTAIQASISNQLALKATYTIKNKSEVPAGTEETDTEAGVTLVYNF